MVCGLVVMYFCTEGMVLLIESPENEWEVAVTAAAVGLMIGVAPPVTFTVWFAPELLALTRDARLDAVWTRWRDRHLGFALGLRLGRGRDDQDRATRVAHGALRNRAQEEAFDALAIVSAHHDQACAELRGELDDGMRGGIEDGMRNDVEGQRRGRMRRPEALQLLLDVCSELLERGSQDRLLVDGGVGRDCVAWIVTGDGQRGQHVDLRIGSLRCLGKGFMQSAIGLLREV